MICVWNIVYHFEDRFPPYVLTAVSQFNAILTQTTQLFKFLWLEFWFKSFLGLNVHFKGFMCICMRKLRAKCQMPADAKLWSHCMFQNSFQITERQKHYRNFWVIGQNFGIVY